MANSEGVSEGSRAESLLTKAREAFRKLSMGGEAPWRQRRRGPRAEAAKATR